MHDPRLAITAVAHMIAGTLGRFVSDTTGEVDRDRGAVSIETVLWYAAAAVSVAVVAGIIWNSIQNQANTGVEQPGL